MQVRNSRMKDKIIIRRKEYVYAADCHKTGALTLYIHINKGEQKLASFKGRGAHVGRFLCAHPRLLASRLWQRRWVHLIVFTWRPGTQTQHLSSGHTCIATTNTCWHADISQVVGSSNGAKEKFMLPESTNQPCQDSNKDQVECTGSHGVGNLSRMLC